jgi:hypothetical protein
VRASALMFAAGSRLLMLASTPAVAGCSANMRAIQPHSTPRLTLQPHSTPRLTHGQHANPSLHSFSLSLSLSLSLSISPHHHTLAAARCLMWRLRWNGR